MYRIVCIFDVSESTSNDARMNPFLLTEYNPG